MKQTIDRREFIKQTSQAAAVAGLTLAGGETLLAAQKKPLFEISLAEWSLHKALFAKQIDNLDFAKIARQDFGIGAIEYVNQFFKDKAKDMTYLKDLNQRAKDNGVYQHLIMIDGEGALGDPDDAKRTQAVENHYRWIDAAQFLGCKMIRVNAQSRGTAEEQMRLAAELVLGS